MEESNGIAAYLSAVKEGDKVFCASFSGKLERVLIAKTTKTQIILSDGSRFKKSTGEEICTQTWGRCVLLEPTQETRARWQKQFLARWSAQALPALFKTLTIEQQLELYRQAKSFDKANKSAAATSAEDDEGHDGLDEEGIRE
ncbi:hypothetical protein ISF12_10860 [Pseudomonas aeruginosa]|nr:hypothetical protein [Pseudomonas aeruginosa]